MSLARGPSRPLASPAAPRLALNVALDGVLAALGVLLAFWLASPAHPMPHPRALPLAGAAAIWLIGIPFGLSRLHWRFTALGDLAAIGGAAILAAAMMILLLVGAGWAMPGASFPAILALSLATALTAPRLAYRLARERRPAVAPAPAAILVGSGETAELFLEALARAPAPPCRVEAILSFSESQAGRRIRGAEIVGTAANPEPALERLAAGGRLPKLLVIGAPDLIGVPLAALMAIADRFSLEAVRAPSPVALRPAEAASALDLRPIAIEDLLNRPQVPLDRDGMARLIAGKRILVTGAGGSIGSELVRQIAGFGPAELALLDISEFALWQIDLELAEAHPALPRRALVGDVRDRGRMAALCAAFRPGIVFHAAALKHVPIVEANCLEGLLTNACGTGSVMDAAAASGAALMVLISTDKAVNPSSVMGASKRLAEMLCQSQDVAARTAGAGLRCVTVRFGNVLGSTGSVVPLFRRQLERGGPLTVTHPDMRRYFMTISEAVGLVLQASVAGHERTDVLAEGGIFMLDMGEPVRIVDLARQMIRLAGLRPETDIKIAYTGLRPGEKLHEELFHGAETPVPTPFPGLLMAVPRVSDRASVAAAIAAIEQAAARNDAEAARAALCALVPEFLPEPPSPRPPPPDRNAE